MNRLRYYVAWSLLHAALGVSLAGMAAQRASVKLRKFALRCGGVDEEAEQRRVDEEWAKTLAAWEATPPDRYTIDFTTWKGDDGSPVVELVELAPEQFSTLQYTASAKHVTVEALLGEAVRKAVIA